MRIKKHLSMLVCVVALGSFTTLQSTPHPVIHNDSKGTAGTKHPFIMKSGDINLAITGKTRQEYFYAKNVVLLNNDLPDEYTFFRHIADIGLNFWYGTEKFGHKALEGMMVIRQRNQWGDTGYYVQTTSGTVNVAGVPVSGHTHKINRPLLWMKDIWLQGSLNALIGLNAKNIHHIKAGLFP